MEAHKLACLAFANNYGRSVEWEKYHTKVSPWAPTVDFRVKDQTCRIVAVPCNEDGAFGYNTIGKVWGFDYKKNHDVYILAGVYLPYVDFIGWLGRDSLEDYQRVHTKSVSYELQETATRPMSELL